MILPPPGHVKPIHVGLTGLDPATTTLVDTFRLSCSMVDNLEARGQLNKFWDAFLVGECLEVPHCIWSGLRRQGLNHGLCYCLLPTKRLLPGAGVNDPPVEGLPPTGMVFCVTVKPDNGLFFVLDWEWRQPDPATPTHPLHCGRDFVRRAWHRP